MRISIIKLMVLLIFCTVNFNQNCWAYDKDHAHKYINLKAVEKSSVESVLRDSLGFIKGRNEKIDGKEIWEWIRDGGKEEDEPEWRCF